MIVDGNIGAGKSTVMKILAEEYVCFEEPLHEWTLLGDFYKDPVGFAFPFQYQVLLSQYTMMKKPHDFMERCAWTSRNVFVPLMNLKDSEMSVYLELYNKIETPTVMFFLQLDVETCMKRIKQRGRTEESSVSLEYLTLLDQQYKAVLPLFPGEVVYLDATNKTPRELANTIVTWKHKTSSRQS